MNGKKKEGEVQVTKTRFDRLTDWVFIAVLAWAGSVLIRVEPFMQAGHRWTFEQAAERDGGQDARICRLERQVLGEVFGGCEE